MKYLFYSMLIAFIFSSCEDPIDVELDEGRSQLVVDAFITNDRNPQTIRLTQSAPYFLNAPTPEVRDAGVKVIGPAGVEYIFEDQGNGNYVYNPAIKGALDSVGFAYQLQIDYNSEQFMAHSTLQPVPPIDSMTYAFEEEELGEEEGFYSQFWATDFFGRKDYYWIRPFKNGVTAYPENPATVILSEDAAFGGEGADGFTFILPLRAAITNEDDPFEQGDISSVELLSLNEEVYEFLDQLTIQANNGGLFSTPPANIKSNIKSIDGQSQDEVLGVFSLSSISRAEITIL